MQKYRIVTKTLTNPSNTVFAEREFNPDAKIFFGLGLRFGAFEVDKRTLRIWTPLTTGHLTLAFALRRSAQYFFIRADTAFRAAADIVRARRPAVWAERRTALLVLGSANSGNVRSMAMISARSCFSAVSAPPLAHSRRRSALTLLDDLGTVPPRKS
jgi:hypothetical protein